MACIVEDYRHMAGRCLLLATETTDEQHKSVLLRAAAKLNELQSGRRAVCVDIDASARRRGQHIC
jgi:hypothetical protein